jgi:hypothetical protein
MSTTKSSGKKVTKSSPAERRLATPNGELLVIKIESHAEKRRSHTAGNASGVLAKLAKAMARPGVNKSRVFRSAVGKPVYAYFVYSEDPTKIVREDSSGHQAIGRFSGGRFRATTSR